MRLAAALDVDYLAVSFVRQAADVAEARALLAAAGSEVRIVAKIERSLRSGTSINETARKLKVGVGTVHRIKVKMAQAA